MTERVWGVRGTFEVARERRPQTIIPVTVVVLLQRSYHDLAALEMSGQGEAVYASHPNAGSSRLKWCGETEDRVVLAEQEGGREEGQGVDGAQAGQSLP